MSKQVPFTELESGCIKRVTLRIATIYLKHAERALRGPMKNFKLHKEDENTVYFM